MSNQWNNQNQGGFQQNGNWRQPQGGFQQQPQGGFQNQQQPQAEENLYVGTGKLVELQSGRFIKISFRREDLEKMMQHLNANGWVTVNLNHRQQASANGATHYMKIDTWQPNQNQQQGGYQQQQGQWNNPNLPPGQQYPQNQQQGFPPVNQQPQQQQFQQGGFQNQQQQPQQQQQGDWRQQGNWQPDNGGFGGGYDGQEDDIPF